MHSILSDTMTNLKLYNLIIVHHHELGSSSADLVWHWYANESYRRTQIVLFSSEVFPLTLYRNLVSQH